MRFFAYRGTDSHGRPTQGTIQAASADDAQRLLAGGGVRTTSVKELSPSSPAPHAPTPRPAPRPSLVGDAMSIPAPAASSKPTPAKTPVAAVATVSQTPPGLKYRFVGNKTSFFFFDAMGRYLKSGVAPNRALEELGRQNQRQKEWFGERLLLASEAVGKGASLAESLEACQCFPTGCIGTIRAGEASGSLPEACFQAAHGCEQAHKLGSRCGSMTIMFVFFALFAPIAVAMVNGSVDAMEKQADNNSTLPAVQTAATSMWGQMKSMLPMVLPWWIVVIGGWRLWLTHRFQRARHRAIFIVPILSGRAREESLARSSWALTELARAGISPGQSMLLAADACPNLIMADRFRDEARKMHEGTKLSTAMRNTGLMDPQLIDVVENGELAGDVPGAVASVHRATSAEFERKDATTHTRIWFVLYPILGVAIAIVVGILYKTLYLGEFHAMLKDT
jgi:general secretion pathway protein F